MHPNLYFNDTNKIFENFHKMVKSKAKLKITNTRSEFIHINAQVILPSSLGNFIF
jgi:hypothetical protein